MFGVYDDTLDQEWLIIIVVVVAMIIIIDIVIFWCFHNYLQLAHFMTIQQFIENWIRNQDEAALSKAQTLLGIGLVRGTTSNQVRRREEKKPKQRLKFPIYKYHSYYVQYFEMRNVWQDEEI